MAFRRNLGNLARVLLEARLRGQERERYQEGQLYNQLTLNDQQSANQLKLSDQNSRNATKQEFLKDPKNRERYALANPNDPDLQAIAPRESDALAGELGDLGKAANQVALPSNDDYQTELRLKARPGGDTAAMNPENITRMMGANQDRRSALDANDAYQLDQKAAGAQGEAYGRAQGTEEATALNAPAALGRKTAEEEALSPILAARAGKITGAQQAAQEPYEIAKHRREQLGRVELAREARELERTKMAASVAEKVGGADAALYSLEKIEALYKTGDNSSTIGPYQGRVQKARQTLPIISPVDPDFAAFSAEVSTLKNAVIKAVTGAQMSEPEAKRIMQQVPDTTNKNVDFEARLASTKENMTFLRNRILKLSNSNEVPMAMPGGSSSAAPEPPVDPILESARAKWQRLGGR